MSFHRQLTVGKIFRRAKAVVVGWRRRLFSRGVAPGAAVFLALAIVFASGAGVFAQSKKPRLLIIDKNMSAWQMLVGTARPWLDVGCEVTYRRYHPFLVQNDLENYDLVMILGGRTPLMPSAKLTREDVDLLQRFRRAGNGIILGYALNASDEGAYDRAAMNQLLRELRANVQIGDVLVQDDIHRYPATLGEYIDVQRKNDWEFSRATRLALGEVPPLQILRDASVEIFAESYPNAYFKKSKLDFPGPFPVGAIVAGPGPILLLPRTALGFCGVGVNRSMAPILRMDHVDSTRIFLTRVASRFLELAAGAKIKLTPALTNSAIPTTAESRLASLPALPQVPVRQVFPVETVHFEATMQPAAEVLRKSESAYLAKLDHAPVQRFLRDGVKAFYGRLPDFTTGGRVISRRKTPAEIDSTVKFMQLARLNLFWASANPQGLTDSVHYSPEERTAIKEIWQLTTLAFRGESVQWFPGIDYRDFRIDASQTLGMHGEIQHSWAPFDRNFWWQGYFAPLMAAARMIAANRDEIGGVVIDTEFYGHPPAVGYLMGHDYGDDTFRFFLAAASGYLDENLIARGKDLPQPERFSFLVRNGLLPLYYETLMDEAERFGRTLRRRVEAIAPGIVWVVYMQTMPNSWYALGLLRGLSRPENPVILLTFEPTSRQYLAWLRDQDIYALHALAISPWQFQLADLAALVRWSEEQHHGFWLSSLEAVLAPEGVRTKDGEVTSTAIAKALTRAAAPRKATQKNKLP